MLYKPEVSRCLIKWVVELFEFDINFQTRHAHKGQDLVDFIAKFTPLSDNKGMAGSPTNTTSRVVIPDAFQIVKAVRG